MYDRSLITGGCGFLGQYLTKDLLNEFPQLRIKIIDLNPNSNPLFDFRNQPNVEFSFNQNICDYNSIKNEFKNIDLVIHLAGFISFSLKDKEPLEKVNVLGTKNILKAIVFNKIQKLIHISSVAALGYKDDKNITINETFLFDWNIAKKKKKYYMLTKHLADLEIDKYIKQDLQAVIVYPGLMYGPGDRTNTARFIKAMNQEKIPFNMPGGTNVIDVRDVSRGILKVLKNGITKGNFLLSGYNLTFKKINKTIADELSVKYPKLTLPRLLNPLLFHLLLFAETISKNKLELTADNIDSAFKFRYFDNTKAKTELNWEPEISFKQTITDTIKWMKKNDFFEK